MSFALTNQDLPFICFSIEEIDCLAGLEDSPASILKFVGSTVEYIQMNPLEYSKEAALAFHFETSVLNNGPKIVTGRPTQTYVASSGLSGRTALSTDLASSMDLESTTTESDTQNSVDQRLEEREPLCNRECWRPKRLPLKRFVCFSCFAPRRIIFRFAECVVSRIPS